ncbi:hypothetical protein BJV77DRAFT_1150522 [Russula vinacea]|nr:hypothetical protein BJV77DRAFT_1150522 [Russula vinacea]
MKRKKDAPDHHERNQRIANFSEDNRRRPRGRVRLASGHVKSVEEIVRGYVSGKNDCGQQDWISVVRKAASAPENKQTSVRTGHGKHARTAIRTGDFGWDATAGADPDRAMQPSIFSDWIKRRKWQQDRDHVEGEENVDPRKKIPDKERELATYSDKAAGLERMGRMSRACSTDS